jgi:hypothetical protein
LTPARNFGLHGEKESRKSSSALNEVMAIRRPTSACSRRCYRAAAAKALVILASLARKGSGDTRNAADAQAVRPHGRTIMKKISSTSTFISKKVFPLLWFGFLAFFAVSTILTGAAKKDLMFLFVPVVMAAFGFFLMKKLVWDLADEVYDYGDFLLIRNRGEEERVSLSNIMNVSASTYINPARITLRLVNPGKFEKEIAFSPVTRFTLNPFAKNQVAEDLIVRVDQARSKRAV